MSVTTTTTGAAAALVEIRREMVEMRREVEQMLAHLNTSATSKFWSVFFDKNERIYRHGEKRALIMTIFLCSRFNVKLPAWVREAIVEAYLSMPQSWDDVFGRPVAVAKGKSVTAKRRRLSIGTKVIGRVKELHSQGEPIDPALFEKVGKEFGVSGSTVKKFNYDEELLETFKLINDPDDFYKEFYERLAEYRKRLNSKNF